MRSPRNVFASVWCVVAIAAGFLLHFVGAASSAAAQDGLASEPYVVFVAHDEAHTRCGPSGEYYRTDPLRHGQELEVYVETEDGWLGVRPPENSFCWVPASTVELSGNDDTGTIIEDRTVAWIGTNLGRARKYRWQVQLAEGEQVTIIGRSERDGPDGPQLWFRIVPPSGEFRWVHRDQTVDSAEALVAIVQRQQQADAVEFVPVERRSVTGQNGDRGPDNVRLASSEVANQVIEHDRAPIASTGPLSNNPNSSSRRTIRSPGETVSGIAPFQSPSPRSTPQPVAANEIPSFRSAPARSASARSVTNDVPGEMPVEAIGSGLRHDWRSNNVRGSIEDRVTTSTADRATSMPAGIPSDRVTSGASASSASVANATFVGQPRLIDIGSNLDASAPAAGESAGDGNWVIGGRRQPEIAQVSGISPMPAQTLVPTAAPSAPQNPLNVIPREAVARVEDEVRGADVEKLQLVLSRLMAQRASSAETKPLVDEAYRVAQTTPDQVDAGRARLVAERAEQYQRVAERRDGANSAVHHSSLVIPAGDASGRLQSLNAIPGAQPIPSSPNTLFTETGFLVQVYSARTNSPPFALTDHGGNTIAYVTPSPGINLRTHLNSRISVAGSRGYLQGLNTPHIVVSKAVRARE